jgi:TonB family protein
MNLFETIVGLAGTAETASLMALAFLKVAIVLGLALLIRKLLSRAHPDRRHLLLRIALVAAVVLPVLSFALPTYNLHLFDTLLSSTAYTAPDLVTTTFADGRLPANAVAGFPWVECLVLLWLVGALIVLFRLGYGLMLRSKILRQSRPFDDDEGLKLAIRLSEELKIRKPVRVAVSSLVGGPVAWSFTKPTIILPSASLTWSLGDLKLALVHELSHVKRRDDVWMLVGSLATALHWYNPLIWLVRDRLTLEADNVCDGYVVNSGADSTIYARFMLATARECIAIKTPVIIGSEIIGKKQLEVRIMSIQNGSVRSHQVRRSLVRLAWVLTLSISIPVAAMRLAGGSATADTTKSPSGTKARQSFLSPDSIVTMDSGPVPVSLPQPVYPDSAIKAGLVGTVRVQVLVDTTGNVADAKINKTSGHECFDRSALDAAKKSKWLPAMDDGHKVAVWISYPITFTLTGKNSDTLNTTKNPAKLKSEQYPSPDSSVRAETMPVAIDLPRAVYPDEATKAGLEGTVGVQVLVDTAGNAADARISKTSGHEFLDQSALEAARKSKWIPAMQDGHKVAVWVSYSSSFSIKEGFWHPDSGTKGKK